MRIPRSAAVIAFAAVAVGPAAADDGFGLFPEGEGDGGLTEQIREVSPLARALNVNVRPIGPEPGTADPTRPRIFRPPPTGGPPTSLPDPPGPGSFDGGWVDDTRGVVTAGWEGVTGGLSRGAGVLGGAAAGTLAPANWTARFTTVGGDDLGLDTFDVGGTYDLAELPPVALAPAFGVTFVDGPHADRADLPPRLYAASADLQVMFPLVPGSRRWIGQLGLTPAFQSDGENTSGDALRLPARAVVIYQQSERTQFVFGVGYFDREDVGWVPAVGLIHRLSANTKLELIPPRPRVVWRLWEGGGSLGLGYVAGEFGGGSFAVRRQSGRDDVATLRDYRLLLGLEVKNANGSAWLVEGGGVFGRELEFARGPGDVSLDPAVLLRAGLLR